MFPVHREWPPDSVSSMAPNLSTQLAAGDLLGRLDGLGWPRGPAGILSVVAMRYQLLRLVLQVSIWVGEVLTKPH